MSRLVLFPSTTAGLYFCLLVFKVGACTLTTSFWVWLDEPTYEDS